jgi:hypothetical protein
VIHDRAYEIGSLRGAGEFWPVGLDGVAFERRSDGSLARVESVEAAPGLRVRADRRSIVLESTLRAPVHVNGRPVRELALLRPGDRIASGPSILLVRTRRSPSGIDDGSPDRRRDPADGAPRVFVRCLVGRFAGQARDLDVGGAVPWTRPEAVVATIGVEGTEVVLRSRAAGAAWVDGHPVDVARLEGGEQVVVGDEHYVVDVVRQAPPAQAVPKPQGGESEPAAQPPGAGDPIDSTPRSGFSPWWLLAASALIAGALAMLLGRISG